MKLAHLLLPGLLLVLGACDGPKLPRFARPLPYDAGVHDAQVDDEDGGR